MIAVSDELDLSFYKRLVQYQTESEWKRIMNIYQLLRAADSRQPVSVADFVCRRCDSWYPFTIIHDGGRDEVVNAPDCGYGIRRLSIYSKKFIITLTIKLF